jgi:hypothetical protein
MIQRRKICTKAKKDKKKSKALRQKPNPREKPILMLYFDPILHQKNIMDKLPLPFSERANFSTNNLAISEQPNIPAGQNENFHEEGLGKAFLCTCQHNLHIIMRVTNQCVTV